MSIGTGKSRRTLSQIRRSQAQSISAQMTAADHPQPFSTELVALKRMTALPAKRQTASSRTTIESLLNGSVQLLITSVPITGNFFVSARQLSITALFDLQKDQHKLTNVNTELLGDVDKLETDQQQPKNNRRRTKAPPPPMLRFPGVGLNGYQRKTVEMIISELSANEAFRAKMMKVRLGPNSAVFGQMLRTICGPDEVCLSDFVKDSVTVHLVGNATIFLSQNGKSIGRIPFKSLVELGMARNSSSKSQSATTKLDETAVDNTTATTWTHGKIMDVSLSIPTLALRGDAFDFFGLSPQTVESFLNTVRNAIQNTAGKALSSGVSLVGLERHLCPYGISQPGILLLDDGLVLLNAELDAYVLLFDGGGIGTQQKQQQKRRHCSPTEL